MNAPNVEDAKVALIHAKQCLEVLLRESSLELAAIVVIEETPNGSDLPEQGLSRWVRGVEIVSRALAHVNTAGEFLAEETSEAAE